MNISSLHPTLNNKIPQSAIDKFELTLQGEDSEFYVYHEKEHDLKECLRLAKKFSHKKYFVQIGIGGSALGAQMLNSAFPQRHRQFTCLDNTDPDALTFKLNSIDIKESVFYIVSKSGSTAETIAALSVVLNKLEELGVSEKEFKDYLVLCTDPKKSQLLELKEKWELECLFIPSKIGGRFSVLTPVGMFPAAMLGINIDELHQGAQSVRENLEELVYPAAAQILGALKQSKINQTVLMPYSSLLREFSHWFVQLWGESLGKEGIGLTPIPAFGATDQHSQMQLFMEGPVDKLLIMLKVKRFQNEVPLSSRLFIESAHKLSSYSMQQLIHAQFDGTLKALKERQRAFIEVEVEEVNAFELGALIMWSKCLTSLVGHGLEIDPFNQPGVELGKVYAYEFLKNLS